MQDKAEEVGYCKTVIKACPLGWLYIHRYFNMLAVLFVGNKGHFLNWNCPWYFDMDLTLAKLFHIRLKQPDGKNACIIWGIKRKWVPAYLPLRWESSVHMQWGLLCSCVSPLPNLLTRATPLLQRSSSLSAKLPAVQVLAFSLSPPLRPRIQAPRLSADPKAPRASEPASVRG